MQQAFTRSWMCQQVYRVARGKIRTGVSDSLDCGTFGGAVEAGVSSRLRRGASGTILFVRQTPAGTGRTAWAPTLPGARAELRARGPSLRDDPPGRSYSFVRIRPGGSGRRAHRPGRVGVDGQDRLRAGERSDLKALGGQAGLNTSPYRSRSRRRLLRVDRGPTRALPSVNAFRVDGRPSCQWLDSLGFASPRRRFGPIPP